jgi:hypothetical protein
MKQTPLNQTSKMQNIGRSNDSHGVRVSILHAALMTATTVALARRKQLTSRLTRHTLGLRWRFMK